MNCMVVKLEHHLKSSNICVNIILKINENENLHFYKETAWIVIIYFSFLYFNFFEQATECNLDDMLKEF